MSELGSVEQRPGATDRRVTIAAITPRGRKVVDEITPGHLRDLRRLVFDQLRPAQAEALADAMESIAEHLKATVTDE